MNLIHMDEEPPVALPDKLKMRAVYDNYHIVFDQLLQNIEIDLRKHISLASNPTYKRRIKSFESYYRKVLRVKSAEALKSFELIPLTDMMGVRVICAFLEDLDVVEALVKKNYKVREVEYKGQANFKEFGYVSTHILIAIPQNCIPDTLLGTDGKPLTLPDDLVCEIQVRTILQDAWAEVEHELVYKSEFSPFDMPMRRKLASINANLSLADIIFQEIRDYQKKLQKEIFERRQSFYEQADILTASQNTEGGQPSGSLLKRSSPYVRGTIDDMILEAIHAHNEGDVERAVKIYSLVLESDPMPPVPVMAVIHKHRGMAFFAQNQYVEALEDFKISNGYDCGNFRTIYYQGIVYSVLQNNKEACRCFTMSLKLNQFQSHAFFRRALAHYYLSEYADALSDLDSAASLGLQDEECQLLRGKLMKKFDMSM